MARFWRVLAAERHSGQCHGIDELFTSRPTGSYAEVCLACPVPGVNVEDSAAGGAEKSVNSSLAEK